MIDEIGFLILLPRHLVKGDQREGYFSTDEVHDWCLASVQGKWRHAWPKPTYNPGIWFAEETDAALFKLFWL